MKHVVGFVHELPHAPAKLARITGLEVLQRTVLSTGPGLAAPKAYLSIGENGDHAESVTPTCRENLALSDASEPIDDKQRWAVIHAVDGVRKTNGEHVVAVLCTQLNRDAPKDARIALKPTTHDLFANHVAHGTDRQGEGRGHVRKFPLPTGGQATDGQNTDHVLP